MTEVQLPSLIITGDLHPALAAIDDRQGPVAVYRLYSDNELLYIGASGNPIQRWSRHATTKAWWPEVRRCELVWHPDRPKALDAERDAIRTEHPRYNEVHSLSIGAIEAEQSLEEWARVTAQRDDLVRQAFAAGLTKNRIHKLTGLSRVTIDNVLDQYA